MMDFSCGLASDLGNGSLRRFSFSNKLTKGLEPHLRSQFTEQLKCLDVKLDIDCALLAELQDFYRRRAALELEYAEGLAKLANSSKQRHLSETSKRSHMAAYSGTVIMDALIGSTLHLSQAHSTMSELFVKQMVQRLVDIEEDAVRIHKQCREMLSVCHDRVLLEVYKLQADQREYASKHSISSEAERLKRRAEERMLLAAGKARIKGKDPNSSNRFLRAQSEYSTKYLHFTDANILTSRARNDYLLQLKAANSSMEQLFSKEAPDIVDCLACGFHNALARASLMHLSCEDVMKNCHGSIVEMLNHTIPGLDWRSDRASFLKSNKNSFSCYGNLRFHAAKDDAVKDLCLDGVLLDQLEESAMELSTQIDSLQASTDKMCVMLDDVEGKLLSLINQKDYDVSKMFLHRMEASKHLQAGEAYSTITDRLTASPLHQGLSGIIRSLSMSKNQHADDILNTPYLVIRMENREHRIEVERFYFVRFSEYTAQMHSYCLLQHKFDYIRGLLDQCVQSPVSPTHPVGFDQLNSSTAPIGSRIAGGDDLCSTPPPPPAPDLTRRSVRRSTRSAIRPVIATPTATSSAERRVKIPERKKTYSNRRVLHVPNVGKPKLFGSTIDEYMKATNEAIPRVIVTCTHLLAQFGLQQRGIFRVPGSQVEINEIKKAFERGQDPFENSAYPRDMNCIAGLLKLYFRELGEPPFSPSIFHNLAACIRDAPSQIDAAHTLGQVVAQFLSRSVFLLMRYLFAFLSHVSEYANDNSMDAYNLAICFGPSLIHVPNGLDQVNQQTTVIDIIKLFIQYHSVVFDPSIPGPVYTKHPIGSSLSARDSLTEPLVDGDVPDRLQPAGMTESIHESFEQPNSPIKHSSACEIPDGDQSVGEASSSEDLLDVGYPVSGASEQPVCNLAVAIADFVANSDRELSFEQGEELFLFVRRNEHWWEGQLVGDTSGTRGLIPHVYVVPKLNPTLLDKSQLIVEEEEDEDEEEGNKSLDELSVDNLDDMESTVLRQTEDSILSTTESHSHTSRESHPPGAADEISSLSTKESNLTVDNEPSLPLRDADSKCQLPSQISSDETTDVNHRDPKSVQLHHSKNTPDLVMDLPDAALSSTPSLCSTYFHSEDKTLTDNFASDSVLTVRKRMENMFQPTELQTSSSKPSTSEQLIEPDSNTDNVPKHKTSIADRVAAFEFSSTPRKSRPAVFPKPKNP